MQPLRIFIGYDSREVVAYHVLAHSILARASVPVSITPLVQSTLRASGLYRRQRTEGESTEFSYTRFLVPHLSGYEGVSVFMDCDMLCRRDIWELVAPIVDGTSASRRCYHNGDAWPCESCRQLDFDVPVPAAWVAMHQYRTRAAVKFLGHANVDYPCKNWSSLIVFNNAECRTLTPEYVNTATPAELHRLAWTGGRIGSLPLEWNWLVGEYDPNPDAAMLHYTLGGPWFPEYRTCDHADDWRAEAARMRARRPMAVRQKA